MDLKTVERLAQSGKTREALSVCESLLSDAKISSADILRVRAYVHARDGSYDKALEDQERVLSQAERTLDDIFAAADYALKAGKNNRAKGLFIELGQMGRGLANTWYESSVLFYLAFLERELGNKEEAQKWISDLFRVSPTCKLPLPDRGMVTADVLKREIDAMSSTGAG